MDYMLKYNINAITQLSDIKLIWKFYSFYLWFITFHTAQHVTITWAAWFCCLQFIDDLLTPQLPGAAAVSQSVTKQSILLLINFVICYDDKFILWLTIKG